MHIRSIDICGFRGFGETGHVDLAIPDGNSGSGLTILVGPNNSGKSTIVESFQCLTKTNPASFTEGKRNKRAGDHVSISITNENGETKKLKTVPTGGSETEWVNQSIQPANTDVFVLPSRRSFNPFFGKSPLNRNQYVSMNEIPAMRSQFLEFYHRLFEMQKHQDAFNAVMGKIINPFPQWTIEQSDSGQYYLKFNYGGQYHNSDGLGEGILSLFFIVDALYDSPQGSLVVIDEPELSLHPSIQKKLALVIAEYAKDRQIVVSTHSPYFVNWEWIIDGARIVRVVREPDSSKIYQLKSDVGGKIRGLLDNVNNPHILGLDAREIFFLDDKIILVEGQEDVIYYQRIAEQLGVDLPGSFYGWGVGGAGNMGIITEILLELGFKKIVGILDNDKEPDKNKLREEYKTCRFECIPAKDVRSKPAINSKEAVKGLLDENKNLRPEYKEHVTTLIQEIHSFFGS